MASTLAVQQSRVIPVSVDDAFAGTLPIPLTTIFSRWYGPIPPVAEVREQEGEWGIAGITGPLGLLVGRAEGEWTFTPSGTATTVTWHWNIYAASALTAPLLPVVGVLWKGYARRSLEVLSAQLVG